MIRNAQRRKVQAEFRKQRESEHEQVEMAQGSVSRRKLAKRKMHSRLQTASYQQEMKRLFKLRHLGGLGPLEGWDPWRVNTLQLPRQSRLKRILQQSGNGHWTYATRNRSNPAAFR